MKDVPNYRRQSLCPTRFHRSRSLSPKGQSLLSYPEKPRCATKQQQKDEAELVDDRHGTRGFSVVEWNDDCYVTIRSIDENGEVRSVEECKILV